VTQGGEDPAPPAGASARRHASTLAGRRGAAGRRLATGGTWKRGQSGLAAARRVDLAAAPEFDARAMPQPSHIYASTLHRRSRRWSRRRTFWPRALRGLAAVSAVAAVVGVLLFG